MIRRAELKDIARLAEIEIFNYRLNFYPIFQNDDFYFNELQVPALMKAYADESALLENTIVYDDGAVKGFARIAGTKLEKLFVEPVLHGNGIGAKLLEYAVETLNADHLWALEKNTRAIDFYVRHGFELTDIKELEEDTTEYLVLLRRSCEKPTRE